VSLQVTGTWLIVTSGWSCFRVFPRKIQHAHSFRRGFDIVSLHQDVFLHLLSLDFLHAQPLLHLTTQHQQNIYTGARETRSSPPRTCRASCQKAHAITSSTSHFARPILARQSTPQRTIGRQQRSLAGMPVDRLSSCMFNKLNALQPHRSIIDHFLHVRRR
jgi:hypothetical protein